MSSSGSKDKKPSGSGSGRIRTLADLNRQPSGSESDGEPDATQEYYTGGEKSGMLVQDPNKRNNNDVDAIFEEARRMGAVQVPFENVQQASSSRVFRGTGRLLSGETVPDTSQPQQPENVVHNVVFWSDGFTVNNGPLRRFADPENASFLESIRKSECPRELEPPDRRSSVHVNLMKRDGKCPEPVKESIPFQGVGRTLGGGSSANSEIPNPSTGSASVPTSTPSASIGLSIDQSMPSTSIQVRLADGTRMVARLNNHHTIGHLRAHINGSRSGSASYKLQSVGFPPKLLDDDSQTIEQAGLINSVVIQKL